MTMLSNDKTDSNEAGEPTTYNNIQSMWTPCTTYFNRQTLAMNTVCPVISNDLGLDSLQPIESLTDHSGDESLKVKLNSSPSNDTACSQMSDMNGFDGLSTVAHNTDEHPGHSTGDAVVHTKGKSIVDETGDSTAQEKEFEASLYVEDEHMGTNTAELNRDRKYDVFGGSVFDTFDQDDGSCYLSRIGNSFTGNVSSDDGNKQGTNGQYRHSLFNQFDSDNGVSCGIVTENVITSRRPSVDVTEVFKQDEDGDTLLHIAVICLSLELSMYIIDNTPNFTWLNVQNKLFQSPLHLAVLTKQATLVRRLVVGGADLGLRDHEGNMPIHLACKEDRLDCLRALLQPVRYEEQKRNNYDIPFQAIPQNLNSKNCEGLPCLHIATLDNNIEIVKVLTEVGADVNEKAEKSGRTILHEAAWSGNLNLVKYLLSLGRQCNINARTYDDYTPFDFARSRGNWSVVLELATAGAKYEDEKDLY